MKLPRKTIKISEPTSDSEIFVFQIDQGALSHLYYQPNKIKVTALYILGEGLVRVGVGLRAPSTCPNPFVYRRFSPLVVRMTEKNKKWR